MIFLHHQPTSRPDRARGIHAGTLNQMTETHRVRDLARMSAEGARVDYLPNPRNEADENDLHVKNDRFLALGLEPITLGEGPMEEVTDIARKYAHRCDRSEIPCLWL